MVRKSTLIYIAIAFILLSVIIFLGVSWMNAMIELRNQSQIAKVQLTNSKIIDFLELFIDKVLKNDQEIIFEDRLQLENAVIDLKDQQILDQWRNFTNSDTETEAQQEAIDLLDLLVRKAKE